MEKLNLENNYIKNVATFTEVVRKVNEIIDYLNLGSKKDGETSGLIDTKNDYRIVLDEEWDDNAESDKKVSDLVREIGEEIEKVKGKKTIRRKSK